MKKLTVTLFTLLSLSACRQQDSELTSASTTKTPIVQASADSTATPQVATCQVNAPLLPAPDQPNADSELAAYLQKLQQAVKAHSTGELKELLSPDIRTGFDGSGGWSSFTKQWNPEDAHSEVWLLLEHMTRLGGDYPVENNQDLYALPYVYSSWPDSLDAFTHIAVTNPSTILRQEPAANAPAACTLSQVILKADPNKSYPLDKQQKEWWHVQTADGELQGYLYHTDVYSPVGYRAIFSKNKQGQWQMTALVAGD
ncbi:hypothetical protein POKO110462_20805 [Pontibacter korlensis]|uniref:SH3b domain-containing protein n=1 Tax=Pontibacter korlensis TaxID=400092 RepID=A0A0E3ZD40_9BACT|nr:hypothetical protein [Pontibacter korlensis]AKD02194.1 hypothetical protein PKOR_02400 [Pontibacter korlensis]